MTGVANTIREVAPYVLPIVTGGAGAMIGGYFDGRVKKNVHDLRSEAFSDTLSGVGVDNTAEDKTPSIRGKFGNIALAGLAAGVVAGQAWSFEVNSQEDRPVQIVVDKSGVTSTEQNGDPENIINEVVETLGEKFGEENSQVIALSAGGSESVTAKNISSVNTQGSADLSSGVRLALREDSSLEDPQPIVVVSYGEDKLPKVNKQDAQLSIVSVGEKSSDMRKATEKSGGVFAQADTENAEKVASEVAEKIDPNNQIPEVEFNNPLPVSLGYTGLAGLIALGGYRLARRTRIVRQGQDVVMTVGGRK